LALYAGIDLHCNNSVVSVLDENDRLVFAKRLPNDLAAIIAALRSCTGTLRGVAVESTYNWYWLVDGLQDAGFALHLVNTAAVKQYDGLKYSGDFSDARHLAHLLRLGIQPTGYIYPREERAVRDLLRKRGQLVRQRSTQILSMSNLLALTIALDTGDVGRFDSAGNFASYARTVGSRRESNGKKKGEGNAKCGNKHLAWAFIEAAHFAVRYDAAIKRWYQKKCASSLAVVAIKAVARKLARACYHVMKHGKPFDVARAFG
jgi:transposase